MFTLSELQDSAQLVHRHMAPTPAHDWPLLAQALGARVIVKHENHAPTGAFKVRGGITFIDWLRRTHPECRGIVTATRGNHGQSQARAAVAAGLEARIVVPRGNASEKNAAMRAYGATLIEHGDDFDTARELAMQMAETEPLFPVPPFHHELLRGVASYGYELFTAHPDLDVVYVPIGCGSGICGTIAARDALGAKARVVGVVSERAQTAKLSAEAGQMIETPDALTFADGMAVRVPVQAALDIYGPGADHIGTVSEDDIATAIRLYYTATHNLAEGAGAAALALALKEREQLQGRKVGLILSGGNIDAAWFRSVLAGEVPQA
ncbi:threonine dehydratase [Roseovarius halotolerans]|uniref:L-threonine dehydratase biosynthetic IlvA n=1 Tax=Roseovarius halotolerans TaxID=505353 RepID=A0A1X6YVH1_9RHOB|nr:threonine dehydratase [Roseovarius halotolerans]RKT32788.1 threonine dehydratase [Roseovarius halotolerans]SLN32576.1 L-threonine dehydratase biosynthetic IlvA [Roseovarius halotolerans]